MGLPSNRYLILAGLLSCMVAYPMYTHFSTRDVKASEPRKVAEVKPKLQTDLQVKPIVAGSLTEPRIDSQLEQSELAKLIAAASQSSAALSAVEKSCPMYQEFRRLDFRHPAVKRRLCRNAEAYKPNPDGSFPMCQLPNPFDQDMLNVVREGSEIVGLLDLQNIRLPMFVYKGNDLISNEIRRTSVWEAGMVHWILRFTLKLHDVTFLDMGSNIGAYSLQAANLGLPVVALDANIRNLLRLRLSLNAASRDATLLWHFISPDQSLKYLSFLADCNVGGAGKHKADLPDTVPVMPLRTERISNLVRTRNIVMKMDIQGGETDFLRTSGRMFTDFNVAAVMMEWSPSFIRSINDSLLIAAFFTNRGYKVWRVPAFEVLNVGAAKSWGEMDILWVRQDFLKMM